MTSGRHRFSSPQPQEAGRDCLSPESTYESHGIVSRGLCHSCANHRGQENRAQGGAGPGCPWKGGGAAPLGKKVLFPGKDGKGCWAEEDTRCPWQTASEYISLSTNACPIKGQFHFVTWYQINFNSDNYPS